MTARDDERAKCIEAIKRVFPEPVRKRFSDWVLYRMASDFFDSLNGLARVNPIEATEDMCSSASEFDENSQQACRMVWRAMSTTGDLTNDPEQKP